MLCIWSTNLFHKLYGIIPTMENTMTPIEAWLREYIWRYGEYPDMSATSNYDYNKAISAGIQPKRAEDGYYHWPSVSPTGEWLKKEDHPTRWMEWYSNNVGYPKGIPEEYNVYKIFRGLFDY